MSDEKNKDGKELSDEEALAFLMAEAAGETPKTTDEQTKQETGASEPELSDAAAMAMLAEMEAPAKTNPPSTPSSSNSELEDAEALALLAQMEAPPAAASPVKVSSPPVAVSAKTSLEDAGEIKEWEPSEFQSDPTMMEDFLNNTNELMDTLDKAILNLESDPTSKDTIEEIFRAAHTLKGAAGMFGFKALERVMHRMENMFDQVRKGKLIPNSSHIDLVFKGMDVIKILLDAIKNGAPCGYKTADIVNALTAAALGESVNFSSASPTKHGDTTAPAATLAPSPSQTSDSASNKGGDAPSSPADSSKKAGAKNKEASTIRVDLQRLDALVNLVGELVIDRTRFNAVEEDLRTTSPHLKASAHLQETTQLFARHMNEIQNIIMNVRMVPIGNAFNKYPRIVRDLARALGKEMDLVITGESAELDKTLVEQIGDPLIHLIRNACDHGVEKPEVRIAAGKKPKGTIRLSAIQEGNNIVISIEDDGKGMDPVILRKKAIEKGIISETAKLKESEIFSLIFEPGFSTAEKVTEVSGRGVGMDVVKRQIAKLKGNVTINSLLGKGSTIRIELPLTLAIVKSLLVKVENELYAIPANAIVESLRIAPKDIQKVGDSEIIKLRNKVLPLMHLKDTLRLATMKGSLVEKLQLQAQRKLLRQNSSSTPSGKKKDRLFVVVVGTGDRRFGIVVDQLLNQQEMVIKSMGPLLKEIPVFLVELYLDMEKLWPFSMWQSLKISSEKKLGDRICQPKQRRAQMVSALFSNDHLSDSDDIQKSIFTVRGDLDGENQETFEDFSQYIGILVGGEEFLISIEDVREIVMPPKITFIPGSPKFVAGVINLRGTIIPALSLREMMDLESKEFDSYARIVVVRCKNFLVGLVVDGITYVVPLGKGEVEQTALSSGSRGSQLISAIGNRGDRVNGIMSVEKIVGMIIEGDWTSIEVEEEAA